MVDHVIETHELRKEFRTRRGERRVAVAGLDLAVPEGGVHGFLGPNGSGKTTTIRMLLGLVRADSGSMTVFGQTVPERLPEERHGPGVRADQAEQHPDRRRLARPVGTEEAVHAALRHGEVEARDRHPPFTPA